MQEETIDEWLSCTCKPKMETYNLMKELSNFSSLKVTSDSQFIISISNSNFSDQIVFV